MGRGEDYGQDGRVSMASGARALVVCCMVFDILLSLVSF